MEAGAQRCEGRKPYASAFPEVHEVCKRLSGFTAAKNGLSRTKSHEIKHR
jgi:hypothetical protein